MSAHLTRSASAALLVLLVGCLLLGLAPEVRAQAPVIAGLRCASGEVSAEGDGLIATSAQADLVIGEPNAVGKRITAELQLAHPPTGAVEILVLPSDLKDLAQQAEMRINVSGEATGRQLLISRTRWDKASRAWKEEHSYWYSFWPLESDAEALKGASDSGLPERTWRERWLPLEIRLGANWLSVWLDGRLIQEVPRPAGAAGPAVIRLAQGDRLRSLSLEPLSADERFIPVDIRSYAGDSHAAKAVEVDGIPFETPASGALDLRRAEWVGWKLDSADYYERYDGGPYFVNDPRMPFLRVPIADYVAAHVLAVADESPDLSPRFTLRAGRYDYAGQVARCDFVGEAPRGSAPRHVRVPMTEAFAQDIGQFIEIEVTKEVRLARRSPDPARFRYRPLGLPSGVRIAAITLERSPLQMRVTSREAGHAFVQPQVPTFTVRLQNITDREQPFGLTFRARHLYGTKTEEERSGSVAPGETRNVRVPLPSPKRGYYDLEVTLADGRGRTLLQRHTSFALLPPNTRKYHDQCPFGTWDFSGTHFTPDDPDQVGPLYQKAGLRYGMFGFKPEMRAKYGLLMGAEPVALTDADGVRQWREANPDLPKTALIFHENSISGKHVTRIPDLFTDRPPYQMDETEQAEFQKMWDMAVGGAKAVRQQYPDVHMRFGNGPLTTKEEFYRHKFPAELFDSGGNEAGHFERLPEAQPPDYVANNASLWMDRQLLDAYGYGDKPVTQCYEMGYPGTNPGNLSQREQADYTIRNGLHSLAWRIPTIRPGCITDMGNSYYYSNWGSTGFCNRRPEINVKPSYVAVATMTLVLDGAKYVRTVPLGSPSRYGMEFARPDGNTVVALWTIRGKRPVTLQVMGNEWMVTDDQANETALDAARGAVTVMLTPTPIYLVGKGTVEAAEPGTPQYDDKPTGKTSVLSPLAKLDEWQLVTERDPELETYDFMTPRRKGDFAFEEVRGFEGKDGVLKVTPRPITTGKDTMPMYAVLAHKTGIPVPGTPTEIGLWINGNSGWGRIIFELRDASGQRWISVGAQQEGDLSPWLQDWMPREMLANYKTPGLSDWNTEDVFGWSRINFDGWRYVAFPMPGNYPGEGYHWPGNSQWRWDKDGIVHYPLTLTKIVVELPEKVLHATDWAPVPRQEIYLKDLLVSQGDTEMLKSVVRD